MRMTQDMPMMMTVHKQSGDIYDVDLSKPPLDTIEDDRPVSVCDALVRAYHVTL